MKGQAPRAATSTVIVVGAAEVSDDVYAALEALVQSAGVRPIVVTLGDQSEPRRSDRNGTTVIEGLLPRYLDNAFASLRLSSLPAIAWWRQPSTDGLEELADLVDRVILDVADPTELWALVPELSSRTGLSDLRWTRLTRWRDLFAQFFDLPEARAASEAFTDLEITGGDPHAARLLAGWIRSRLPDGERLKVTIAADGSQAPIRSLRLRDDSLELSLRLLASDICIETVATLPGVAPCSRVVSAGDQRLAALLGEELRVRSRDVAFEAAVAAAGGIP